ncbi:hypothetical protein Fmac_026035 [Flemingia macrophylla]|uniref:Uncharacterized protein n=1 Tax=Flemingia macrophylla TaxID=520843 RepID=A0ABD1LDQ5_9FABA
MPTTVERLALVDEEDDGLVFQEDRYDEANSDTSLCLDENGVQRWDPELRAELRRGAEVGGARWLREEGRGEHSTTGISCVRIPPTEAVVSINTYGTTIRLEGCENDEVQCESNNMHQCETHTTSDEV